MNDSEPVFVSEYDVRPTENEDGLVFVTLGSASHFVLAVRDAMALGLEISNAAKSAEDDRKKALQRAIEGLGGE
jgi:hypothetical protein